MRLDTCHIRKENEMRPVTIERGFMPYAEGSALVTCGNTKVICTATVEEGIPKFMEPGNGGWLTAEYAMLPRATQVRNNRPIGKVNGRSQEIQRLIGRSLTVTLDHNMESFLKKKKIIGCTGSQFQHVEPFKCGM